MVDPAYAYEAKVGELLCKQPATKPEALVDHVSAATSDSAIAPTAATKCDSDALTLAAAVALALSVNFGEMGDGDYTAGDRKARYRYGVNNDPAH